MSSETVKRAPDAQQGKEEPEGEASKRPRLEEEEEEEEEEEREPLDPGKKA